MAEERWTKDDLVTRFLGVGFTSPTAAEIAQAEEFVEDAFLEVYGEFDWSYLRENGSNAQMTLWSTATGTGTSSGAGGLTFTATVAKFFPTMVGRALTIASVDFTITAFTSSTIVTLSADPSASGADFTVTADGFYRMPRDFAEPDADPVITTENLVFRGILRRKAIDDIRDAQVMSFNSLNAPRWYDIVDAEFDEAVGIRKDLFVFEIPSTDTTIYFPYRRMPTLPTAGSKFPMGCPVHGPLILSCALMLWEEQSGRIDGTFHRAYYGSRSRDGTRLEGKLGKSIARDRQQRPRDLGPTQHIVIRHRDHDPVVWN